MAKKKRQFGDPTNIKLDTTESDQLLETQLNDQLYRQFGDRSLITLKQTDKVTPDTPIFDNSNISLRDYLTYTQSGSLTDSNTWDDKFLSDLKQNFENLSPEEKEQIENTTIYQKANRLNLAEHLNIVKPKNGTEDVSESRQTILPEIEVQAFQLYKPIFKDSQIDYRKLIKYLYKDHPETSNNWADWNNDQLVQLKNWIDSLSPKEQKSLDTYILDKEYQDSPEYKDQQLNLEYQQWVLDKLHNQGKYLDINDPSVLYGKQLLKFYGGKDMPEKFKQMEPSIVRDSRAENDKKRMRNLELAMATIATAPFLAYTAVEAAPVLWNATKYMFMHPIESFIAPEVVRMGVDKIWDGVEHLNGFKVNNHIRNGSEIAASMIFPSMWFNQLRNRFGAKALDLLTSTVKRGFGDKFATAVRRNPFIRSQFTYAPGYTAAGKLEGELSKLDRWEQWGRKVLPYAPSAVVGVAESYLPEGSISGMLQGQYDMPEWGANAIDFGINTLLNHHLTQLVHRYPNRTASALDQISEGNQNTDMAMKNMVNNFNESTVEAIKTGEPATVAPKTPNGSEQSYQGAYLKSDKQIEHNIRLLPYTTDPDLNINLRTEMAAQKKHKIGDTLINGNAVITDIVLTGSGKIKGSKPDQVVSRIGLETNNTPGKGRYADGQELIIIETANSEKLPPISEMVKDGNWRAVNFQNNGELVPITMDGTIPMEVFHGDLNTGGRSQGKNVELNTGNHQIAILEHNGEFYAVQVDLSGTGSATTGNAAAVKRFADSGEKPFILSKVTKIDPNIPLEKQLKLYSTANKFEDTISMERLFNGVSEAFKNTKGIKSKIESAHDQIKQNIGEIVEENNAKRKEVVRYDYHVPKTVDPETGQVKKPYWEEITAQKANKEAQNKAWETKRKLINKYIETANLPYKNMAKLAELNYTSENTKDFSSILLTVNKNPEYFKILEGNLRTTKKNKYHASDNRLVKELRKDNPNLFTKLVEEGKIDPLKIFD